LFLYERNSDAISTEKTLQNETRREALEEGRAEGRIEGEAKGRIEGRAEGLVEGEKKGEAKGRVEERKEFIIKMWQKLQSVEEIHVLTDIPLATIEEILKQHGINT
jgi:predicted transposase YdaD